MPGITEKILASKKFRGLYRPMVERVVAQSLARYGSKRVEKEAKNLLHQIWGAYWQTRPNFERLLAKCREEISRGVLPKKTATSLLALQSSTRERLPILDDFYREIFAFIGRPVSVVDCACGLNPLSLPWMGLPRFARYTAFDIDKAGVIFLNQVLTLWGFSDQARVKTGDLLAERPFEAEVVFLLKTLPCLEHQQKGCSLAVLRKQKCNFLVVSFPVRSLGGRQRSMAAFYGRNFRDLIAGEGWEVEELSFPSELVFVVKK